MRHAKALLGILILLAVPLLMWVGLARAQEFKSGDNVTVPQGQTINSSLWSTGRNIDISGTVNGDVFCAGQSVNISATVNGDVICAGQDVRISGPVSGDVRVAGQSVSVNAKINGNLTAGAQTFTLDQNASIGGDASVGATDITLNGTINRDFVAGGTTITLANLVGRNVKVGVSKLTLASSAKVGGNLTYTSHNNATIDHGATVAGTTHRSEPTQRQHREGMRHIGWLFGLYALVSLLVLAVVLVLVLPRLFVVVSDAAVARPWWVLLTGFLGSLIFPMLFVVLMATVIGIPLAMVLLLAWMLIFAIGSLSFDFWIGRLIFRGRGNAVLAMLVGAIIVLILLMVPVLGFFVFLAMAWWGIGMVLTALWRHFQRPSYGFETVTTPTAGVDASVPVKTTSTRTTNRRKR